MKKTQDGESWFFVDESGDPTFYDGNGNYIVGQEGCSPLLMIGFIVTRDPQTIRKAVLDLQQDVIKDPYFQTIPSIKKTGIAFHAKDDAPEVRYRFYKMLESLDFRAQFILARKHENIFRNRFHAKESKFYDYLITLLFQNCLHSYSDNYIYFAHRGSRTRQAPITEAIEMSIARFEYKHNVKVSTNITVTPQTLKGEPCLSVIDYLNWAIYRAYTKGEMRFYRSIESKVSFLVDLYDQENIPGNRYSKKNPFDISKATPLGLGSITERTA